jgi:hypothetical protein
MKTTMRILMAMAAAVLLAAGTARAANSTWTNTVSSTFNDAASWDNGEPGITDTATFNAGGASYTVTFDASKTNAQAIVVAGGGNVTWDLNGGKDYRIKIAGGFYGLIATNAGDTGTLTIMNGTTHTVYGYGGGFNTGPGINVVLTNKAYVTGTDNSSINIGGTLTVVGDATVYMFDQMDIANLRVYGGSSSNFLRSGYIVNAVIDNSTVQGWAGLVGGYGRVGTINITNGGVYTASRTPHGPAGVIGGADDGFIWMNIGGGSDMTRTSLIEGTYFNFGRNDNASGSAHVTIYSNGIARVTTNNHPIAGSNYGTTDFKIQDQQALTLIGGSIQMTNASRMNLIDYRTATTPGILRGYGDVSRIGSGANFSIQNDGYIRPGDTGTSYTHNVQGFGMLTLNNGSLYQTNAVRDGRLLFDFSTTSLDQINIQGGLAQITAGTNLFSIIGAGPVPGVKYGLGVYDFLIATNITYTPAYDNLVNLLTNTYNLTYGVDFQYGIVNLGGGLFALQLSFVPEPSTVLLLALGGLMVWRRIAKRGKK